MLGYAVAVMSHKGGRIAEVLDVLGMLNPDTICAVYYALPEERRATVTRDPVWAYHVAQLDLEEMREARWQRRVGTSARSRSSSSTGRRSSRSRRATASLRSRRAARPVGSEEFGFRACRGDARRARATGGTALPLDGQEGRLARRSSKRRTPSARWPLSTWRCRAADVCPCGSGPRRSRLVTSPSQASV